MIKSVFNIDDIEAALLPGTVDNFMEKVKEDYNRRPDNPQAKLQEFHSELFSFMDLSALSDIEKNELLKILHKHGVEVPLDQDDNVQHQQHQQHQQDLPAGEVDPVDNFIGKVKEGYNQRPISVNAFKF
jgi:hypothetical protein